MFLHSIHPRRGQNIGGFSAERAGKFLKHRLIAFRNYYDASVGKILHRSRETELFRFTLHKIPKHHPLHEA